MRPVEAQSVVVGYDLTSASDPALAEALERCPPGGAVHVVYVEPDAAVSPERRDRTLESLRAAIESHLGRYRARHPDRAPPRVVAHHRVGRPAEEFVTELLHDHAAVVFVGTHGRHGMAQKLGRALRCPVCVVPAEVSP